MVGISIDLGDPVGSGSCVDGLVAPDIVDVLELLGVEGTPLVTLLFVFSFKAGGPWAIATIKFGAMKAGSQGGCGEVAAETGRDQGHALAQG